MIAIYLELCDQLAEPYFMYFFFKKRTRAWNIPLNMFTDFVAFDSPKI